MIKVQTEEEKRLLVAMAWMCEQYLNENGHGLDHMCIGAGETAVDLLVAYGLLKPQGRGGIWTEAGQEVLNSD